MTGLEWSTTSETHIVSVRQRRVREGAVALAAYAAVLLVVYSNVVFFGESLAHSNNWNLIDPRIRTVTHGPHFRPATDWSERNLIQTPNIQDPGATWTQWETGGEFLRRTLIRGDAPFWDPYTGGGVPAMANLTQAFFFPPYLLLVALGNGVLLKNVYFLLLLLTAGWCTWRVLRNAGLAWSSSFVGGTVFMVSGGLTQTAGSFIGQTACCLPVGLLATQWCLRQATWTAAALMGVVFAAIALASFPPILAAIFGFCVLYVAVAIALADDAVRGPRDRAAVRFAFGAVLGVALVAFYYVPAASLTTATPQVTAFYQNASSQTLLRVRDLLQLFAPALMGGAPVWANDPIPHISAGAFHYIGAVALVLVGCSGRPQLRRPLVLAALIGSVVTIGVMAGLPPFEQLRQLPGARGIHFGNYYGILLDFLLALIAAAGFERLQEGRLTISRWLAVTLVLAGGLAAVLVVASRLGVPRHPAYSDWLNRYLMTAGFGAAGAVLILVAAVRTNRRRSLLVVSGLLVGAVTIEGATNAHFPRQTRWEAWAHPPEYVRYLQQQPDLGRVFTSQAVLYANSGSAFGLVQLDSLMTFNSPRMFYLYRRYARTSVPIFLRDAEQLPPDPVLDAANITHIATRSTPEILQALEGRGQQIVFKDDFAAVARRRSLPRYFFTGDFVVDSQADALETVGRPRPAGQIIVERQPSFIARHDSSWADVPVRVERFSNNDVRLSLLAPHAGFVYASEAFFPGWTASVNGRSAAIEPANYAFRAVAVPAGPIVLDLHYLPPGLQAGALVSGGALALLVVMMVGAPRHEFKRRGQERPPTSAVLPVLHSADRSQDAGPRGHRSSRPPTLLSLLIDAALAVTAYVLAYRFRFHGDALVVFLPHAWSTLPWVVSAQLVALAAAGAYTRRHSVDWLVRVVGGVVLGTGAAAVLGATLRLEGLSRVAFAADAGLLTAAAVIWRAAWALASRPAPLITIRVGGQDLIDRTEDLTLWGLARSIYQYRELLKNLVLKDLKLKYRGSVFGFLWSLANPLLMVVVYTIAFTYILGIRTKGFVFYLMLGQLAWSFFASAAMMSTGAIIDNAGLLKSVRFPRAILPIGTVLFSLAQFVLTAVVFIPVMMLIFGFRPAPSLMLFPFMLILQALFAVGVALILATATAFFRDVRHLLEVALAVLFWMTPIVYELSRVPHEGLRLLILLSPMSPFVVGYQQLFFYAQWPDLTVWIVAAVYAIGAFVSGALLILAVDDRLMEHM